MKFRCLVATLLMGGSALHAEESPDARLFTGGAAPMKGENGKWGLRDAAGGWLIQPKFAEVRSFAEEMAAAREGSTWGYLGQDGNWKIPARFSWAGDFAEGLAPASEGDRLTGKFGYIDRQGRWAIEPDYDWARPFQGGLAGVKDGSKWGFVDKKGKLVVEPDFDQIGFFSEGLAPVQKTGAPGDKETWVYIKSDGSRPFEAKFAWAGAFFDGLARVQTEDRITGKFGFIDHQGTVVIPPRYEEASDFRGGQATVLLEGKRRIIDKKGNPVE